MDSASFQFVLLGLVAALVSNFSRSRIWRCLVLLTVSLVFLALLAPCGTALVPLAAFLLFGYAGLAMLERGWSKHVAWWVIAVILVYSWLKKYTFLPEGSFLHFPYFVLGLSYMFFRLLHLLIESREGEKRSPTELAAYLLYMLNFTTFVSGPIQRYDEFARDQFAEKPIGLETPVIVLQLERIIRGFFKVNVLALLLDSYRQVAFERLTLPVPFPAKIAGAFELAVVYPFFLYCNFSGYIDIVIALARLMRVRLPENFDRPFSASSFLDFWNRWHVTLSSWLKTYVYNPLLIALMRRIPSPTIEPLLGVFSFFVTFFLVGVWHGRTSEYVVFGALQGGGVALNKLWQVGLTWAMGRKGYKALAKHPVYIAFGRGLTFSWFAFTLLWFWANWKEINSVYSAISVLNWLGVWLAIWLSATAALALWEWLRAVMLSVRGSDGPVLTGRYARTVYATALGLAAFVIGILLNQPAPGIVYKAF
jgi:alginate O-acetyltransferase complex protein AlgI